MNNQTIDQVLLNSDMTEDFIKRLMGSLVQTSRLSNEIPSGEGGDYSYYSTYPKFVSENTTLSTNVLYQIQQIADLVQPNNSFDLSLEVSDSTLYETIVEVIDTLLEAADLQLDQLTEPSVSRVIKQSMLLDKERMFRENTINMTKPQIKHNIFVDNSRDAPFKPLLTTKPNYVMPLDLQLSELPVEENADVIKIAPKTYYPFPYWHEINALLKEASKNIHLADSAYVNPQLPSNIRHVEFIDKDDDKLAQLLEELEAQKEIAIDLEHHSYRSFQGLTCLMQISTREKDYILDTITLRSKMHLLLPIFTNPNIMKVFHGCDHDILWLQRDFGLYVVGCFDTYQAAKVLRYPILSLAHLLKYYCGVIVNKKYQLADWRVRPLPAEMMQYAQSDTKYLLYIYDCIRRDVFNSQGESGLNLVFSASQRTCMQRFEKPAFYPLGYRSLLNASTNRMKNNKTVTELTDQQDAVISALWNWRDEQARSEDESILYIMSNAELLRIGKSIPLDEEHLKKCAPLTEYVQNNLDKVLLVIKEAIGLNVDRPISNIEATEIKTKAKKIDLDVRQNVWDADSTNIRSKLLGYSTISEFTAAVAPARKLASKSFNDMYFSNDKYLSDPNWQQNMFNEAGWLPTNDSIRSASQASSIHFANQFIEPSIGIFGNNNSAIDSAEGLASNNYMRAIEEINSRTAMPAVTRSLDEAPSSVAEASVKDEKSNKDSDESLSIPKSLAEIYRISNKNRWKNKEKKRNREPSEDHTTSSTDVAASHESTDALATPSVGDLLDFGQSINWVNKESRQTILEEHLEHERKLGHQDHEADAHHNEADSSKKPTKKADNNPYVKGSSKPHHYQQDAGQGSKIFNPSHSAMLGSVTSAPKQTNVHVNNRYGGSTHQQNNPFISSNQYKQNTNMPNKGGGNKQQEKKGNKPNNNNNSMDKRDKNRSHTYSK